METVQVLYYRPLGPIHSAIFAMGQVTDILQGELLTWDGAEKCFISSCRQTYFCLPVSRRLISEAWWQYDDRALARDYKDTPHLEAKVRRCGSRAALAKLMRINIIHDSSAV